ncbi:hypothetical protein [Allorhodopirellula solitaria]|uniref:Uncharacterized protein n=1 Tax=Allorhodopirellula solitaria TaxID=2527987 RepID=A0A5C5YG22_9BACT|nr:hypothetical protein [Allorhodopirellula solitaria]TWT74084.1 hypothetical protein CA85_09700 [Allorhodopirellula solitaria]
MKSSHSNANRHGNAEVSYTSAFTKFVYAVFILNVLGGLLLLVGLLAGWFSVDGDRMSDGTYRLGLVFDSEEVGEDIGETMNAASNLTETAKSASSLETHDGVIKQIDLETQQLILVSEGADVLAHVTDATEFDGDGLANLTDLTVGDEVRLTVQQKNDRLFVVKVKEEVDEAVQ